MSSSINVYAVPLDVLRRTIGSGDDAILAAVRRDRGNFLESIDDIDDEAEMSCADAVADLLNGTPNDDGPGYLYGYALEAICGVIGEELENISGIVGATDWIAVVDAALAERGAPDDLSQLVFGGSPVPIPEPDDAPAIGHWTAEGAAGVAAALRAVAVTTLADGDMVEAITSVRAWAEAAAGRPGYGLVGFLS